jgi:small subunit ribosomal protein S5
MTDAKKKLTEVTIDNGTVPYEIKVKYKAAQVMVHPASKGTGLIA